MKQRLLRNAALLGCMIIAGISAGPVAFNGIDRALAPDTAHYPKSADTVIIDVMIVVDQGVSGDGASKYSKCIEGMHRSPRIERDNNR